MTPRRTGPVPKVACAGRLRALLRDSRMTPQFESNSRCPVPLDIPQTQLDIAAGAADARLARKKWLDLGLAGRAAVVGRLPALLADNCDSVASPVAQGLIKACGHIPLRTDADTIAAEIMPLAAAADYLAQRAPRLLAEQKPRAHRFLPAFLLGRTSVRIQRRPLGLVLVIGPWNYPLFLSGVQILSALVAGNAVMVKPGRGGTAAIRQFVALLRQIGIDHQLVQILPEDTASVYSAVNAGIDKVFFTGSRQAGTAVLAALAPKAIPSVMELSGSDAVIVLPGADMKLVARAIRFSLVLNGGATCMAPRRVLAPAAQMRDLQVQLLAAMAGTDLWPVSAAVADAILPKILAAMANGAKIISGRLEGPNIFGPLILSDVSVQDPLGQADSMCPVLSLCAVNFAADLPAAYHVCPLRLGVSIFGPPARAKAIAEELDAGCISINDLIAPTADPRVVLAPRGASGFGATRGDAGLLEMTSPVSIVQRHGRYRPHLDTARRSDGPILQAVLKFLYGRGWPMRLSALARAIRPGPKGGPPHPPP